MMEKIEEYRKELSIAAAANTSNGDTTAIADDDTTTFESKTGGNEGQLRRVSVVDDPNLHQYKEALRAADSKIITEL